MSFKKLRSKCPCCEEPLYDRDGTAVCIGCGYEDRNYIYHEENHRKPKQEKVPVGCNACGGPFPMCKDSCNLFDT